MALPAVTGLPHEEKRCMLGFRTTASWDCAAGMTAGVMDMSRVKGKPYRMNNETEAKRFSKEHAGS